MRKLPNKFGKVPHPRYDELSERMRNLRHRRGETQIEFAYHFKISHHTYRVWEKCGPPRTAAARIGIKYILRKLVKDHAQKKRRAKDLGLTAAADR
ncbi:MAG TPA: hypothetical protein VN325_23460 [Steroidobacteraceae bacterium]|nr:hypothetical protein [Steroidobacteraceae bacterium]